MAVVSVPQTSSLRIIVEAGKDANDKTIYRTRSYNNVKTNAEDEDLFSVATQLGETQIHPLHAIRRLVESELSDEG